MNRWRVYEVAGAGAARKRLQAAASHGQYTGCWPRASTVWEKAVDYLHHAGWKAAARSAYREPIIYFEQGLAALEHIPESRDTLSKRLYFSRAWCCFECRQGSKGPEVKQTYTRARDLCQKLGETPQLFPVLWGLCRVHDSRGEFHKAREPGEQLFSLA